MNDRPEDFWCLQVRSQMIVGRWNDVSLHQSQATAEGFVVRFKITHPGRDYRIVRFAPVDVIDMPAPQPQAGVQE